MSFREIRCIRKSIQTSEGAGFSVYRPFYQSEDVKRFDPFVLLDEMGPTITKPGAAKGAPDHPHRGFETVTYLFAGEMEHKDSTGRSGKLTPGDVQWMTAGSGVVHSEMPSERFMREGGLMHGIQLWVNLPSKYKMCPPRYQEIPSAEIPVVEKDNISVRIIAGEAFGQKAVIETKIPIIFLHVKIPGGKSFTYPKIPSSYSSFIYIIQGKGIFPDMRQAQEHEIVEFEVLPDGGDISVKNDGTDILDFLLLAGEPINEPVVQHGPFVMNTKEEIIQAFEEFRSGKFAEIKH